MKQVKKYKVSVFNTFTSQYEEVEVSKEVFDEYRRGLWRIKKNNKKHCKHTTPFSGLKGFNEESENFHELIDEGSDPINEISFEMVLDSLDETERDMVEAIVFRGESKSDYAKTHQITRQAVGQKLQRILKKIEKFY